MKLSAVLREMSRRSQVNPHSMILHECADAAVKLERTPYDDVTDFHVKLGYPAPMEPDDLPKKNMMDMRIALIEEETAELIAAIRHRDLSAIAAEAVDVIYVVLGTLVALGLPFRPFWRAIHKANMKKRPNFDGGKAIKPLGWKKPNPRAILYHYKQNLGRDRS